jgi:protein-tyrosine kinase
MSRIHEALKKAEQERAIAQAIDVAGLPQEPVTEAPEWTASSASLMPEPLVAQMPAVATPSEHLRFSDLIANCARPEWHMDPNSNVFFNATLSPHGAEQFRTLRSRLYQLRASQPLRTILVTSSLQGEGKTFVTANLAQAIVRQPDRRALIIDADLRCARVHTLIGGPPAPGLTDYLRGEADEMAVIQHGLEGNLCFIAGGNEVTNPSELLSNGLLKKLLDRLAPVFDWIILDSPPCLPVADATILADVCDGILLVVRSGLTPGPTAQRACQELQGRNVVGVVLNAIQESQTYGSYYYGGYGDKYVYGEPRERETKA